jgi:trimethylamine:corrinoid methyltransferase-like protein
MIYSKWLEMDPRDITMRADNQIDKILSEYEKADLAPDVEKHLSQYTHQRKGM